MNDKLDRGHFPHYSIVRPVPGHGDEHAYELKAVGWATSIPPLDRDTHLPPNFSSSHSGGKQQRETDVSLAELGESAEYLNDPHHFGPAAFRPDEKGHIKTLGEKGLKGKCCRAIACCPKKKSKQKKGVNEDDEADEDKAAEIASKDAEEIDGRYSVRACV